MSYIDEQEQVDMIKAWWRKYGNWLLGGLLVVIIAIAGWQYWQRHEATTKGEASMLYQNVVYSEMANKPKDVTHYANQLQNKFPNTVYAQFATLYLAQDAVNNGDLKTARTQLKWLLSNTAPKDGVGFALARMRLARINLAQNDPQAALDNLKKVPKAYDAMAQVIAGDAYRQLKDYAQAKHAYQTALAAMGNEDMLASGLAKMKLYSLPA